MAFLNITTRIPGRFFRGIAASVVVQALLIAAIVESIFLAEKFSEIFENGIDKHASLTQILLLLVCSAPEILSIALAIAILVAVYTVLLRAREDRELLVLAAAGMSGKQIAALLLVIGFASFAVSLVVSGAIAPMAHYAQRVILFDAEYRGLRTATRSPQFYFFPDHVVFVQPKKSHDVARHIFIHERMGAEDRVMTANGGSFDGPDDQGQIWLHLNDLHSYDFDTGVLGTATNEHCDSCMFFPNDAPPIKMRVRSFRQQLILEQLFDFAPRISVAEELTLPELLGASVPQAPDVHKHTRTLARRLTLALLALLAPLLAAAALTLTTETTRYLALPAACGVLLALDFGAVLLIDVLLSSGPVVIVALLVLGALLLLTLLLARFWVFQHALIRTAFTRP